MERAHVSMTFVQLESALGLVVHYRNNKPPSCHYLVLLLLP